MPASNTEPQSVTAGDSIAWTKSLPDYKASSGWTLHYALQGPAQIVLNSTASGDDHSISVTAETSASWLPGTYIWTSYAVMSADRHTLSRGAINILPDPSVELGISHAKKTLALIEAALENRIPRGLESTTIDGQSISRIPIEALFALRNKYKTIVESERLSALALAGIKTSRTIGIRFVKPL